MSAKEFKSMMNAMDREVFKDDKAFLALLKVVSNKPVYEYIIEVQEIFQTYIQSTIVVNKTSSSGLRSLRSHSRIGDKSQYGSVTFGTICDGNFKFIIKSGETTIHLDREVYFGMKYINPLRRAAPYWMYTYRYFKCNPSFNDQRGESHLWCEQGGDRIQMFAEYVEGVSYYTFLQTVHDSNRQICVLMRLIDAIGHMWKHNITHGDLHASNIKVVTLKNQMYVKMLNVQQHNLYSRGIDIPLMLDFGFATRRDNKVIFTANSMTGLAITHNPYKDIDKLLDNVTTYGTMDYINENNKTVYTKFGSYVNLLKKMVDGKNKDYIAAEDIQMMFTPTYKVCIGRVSDLQSKSLGFSEAYLGSLLSNILRSREDLDSPFEVLSAGRLVGSQNAKHRGAINSLIQKYNPRKYMFDTMVKVNSFPLLKTECDAYLAQMRGFLSTTGDKPIDVFASPCTVEWKPT